MWIKNNARFKDNQATAPSSQVSGLVGGSNCGGEQRIALARWHCDNRLEVAKLLNMEPYHAA